MRPIDARLVAIHGNVSLIPAIALRLQPTSSNMVTSMFASAGYYDPFHNEAAANILLLNIDPNRCHAIYETNPVEHDVDMDDALMWVKEHFDELSIDEPTLIDLPYIRGVADAPTTTLEREYIMPFFTGGFGF